MKIVVGMPVLDKIEAETVGSLVNMLSYTRGHTLFYLPSMGNTTVHESRNYLVSASYKKLPDFNYILFVDADMVFPPNTLETLLEYKKEIVGVLYTERIKGKAQNIFKYNSSNDTYSRYNIVPTGELHKTGAIGAGILLVERSVFDKIRNPWFFYDVDKSEDVNFCHRARMCGFDIYCDTKLIIGHIGKQKFIVGGN